VEHQIIALLIGVLAFAALSRWLTSRWLTAPLLFVAFGLASGTAGLGWLDIDPEAELIEGLAEATLVLVLFADASRIDVRALRTDLGIPLRLLAIGMPLTIALGALLAAAIFPAWSMWEAAVIAAILAPTDAALGQPVVNSGAVPARIRRALNVESGLNDGIALPVVLVFIAMAALPAEPGQSWLVFWLVQVTAGPALGAAIGASGGLLLRLSHDAKLANESWSAIGALTLAGLCYFGAEAAGGNGFMAAFIGGMAFGATSASLGHKVHDFMETEGQMLMLAVFILLGCALAGPALASATPASVAYAALSLTVIRIVPVAIAMTGAGLDRRTVAFLGWFGPRGLASILFGMLLVGRDSLPHGEAIFHVVVLTVLGSVLAHGLTSAWGAETYGRSQLGADNTAH